MKELKPPATDSGHPTLVPPDGDPKRPKKSNLLFIVLLFFVFFILIDLVILGYWFLADHDDGLVAPPVENQQVSDPKTKRVPAKLSPQSSAPALLEAEKDQREAAIRLEKARERWLSHQAQAESEDVALWGGEKYRAIIAEAGQGDEFYQTRKYQAAEAAYDQARGRLESLMALKQEIYEESMALGKQAYLNGNVQGALAEFFRAGAILPQNEDAEHWGKRAGKLETVLTLVQEAENFSESGELQEAEKKLREVLALDAEYIPGRSLLQEVENRQAALAFQQQMTRFYDALEKSHLKDAGIALKEVDKTGVDEALLEDARRQYQAAVQADGIQRLGVEFEKMLAHEQWQKAVKIADKIMAIQPENGLALGGKIRAEKRLLLDRRMEQTLAAPKRLQDKGPLTEAEKLLAYGKTFPREGKRLQAQITALEQLLTQAKIEIEVTLYSDESTDVVVYRVGKLGRFSRKKILLRPGEYTLVGSKAGFRDFRQTMVIAAGKNREYSVICKEPI